MAVTPIRKAVQPAAPFKLEGDEQALFDRMVQGFRNRRIGAKRYVQKTVDREIWVVNHFLAFTKKAPWNWTEPDFDDWCNFIGLEKPRRNSDRKGLAVSSQRSYQGAIKQFLNYCVGNSTLRNDVRKLFGVEMQQICTPENMVPHTQDRELSGTRRAFTHAQIELFFRTIDEEIAEAARFNAKGLKVLMRDKVAFTVMYYLGLRISECLRLDVDCHEHSPDWPELGDYGYCHVLGKGSRGSGPRHGTVPVTHPNYKIVMTWYLEKVRPLFMEEAVDPNEQAMFLSERGTRLTLSSLEARFAKIRTLAGLDGKGLVSHSFRHSSTTHEQMRKLSIHAVQIKLRHKYQATTQGYTHLPDEFIRDQIGDVIGEMLDITEKSKESKV